MISIKSEREIEIMREAAQKLRNVFFELKDLIRPGTTGIQIDEKAEKVIRAQNAKPAFKGYRGYPGTVCISINEQVVHGIPSSQRINEGDIVSLDMGLIWKDFYSDAARTWPVGKASESAAKLIRVTKESLFKGLDQMKVGNRIGDISAAVQQHIESNGFSVVRDFVGHGIGRALHEDPQVPNFGTKGKGQKLEAGMVLAIEPMVNMGTCEVEILKDEWTVVTKDRKWSAHYEDTICLRAEGPENLTADPLGKI